MNKDEIRAIRRKLGLNRSDFGKLIGVSGRTVEHYELGYRCPGGAATINIKRLRDEKKGE